MTNKKPSMSMLQREDLILKHLIHGPVQQNELYNLCFTANNGGAASKQFAFRLMSRMVERNLIIKNHFTQSNYKYGVNVLSLSRHGAAEAARRLLIDRAHIRNVKLTYESLQHELHMTHIFRKINEEVSNGAYGVHFLWDERTIRNNSNYRQTAQLREAKKRGKQVAFPDCSIGILPKNGKNEVIFYIELDMGTKPSTWWIKKISDWRHSVAIIVTDSKRYIMTRDYVRRSQCGSPILLALYTDFINGGMKSTEWYNVRDNVRGRLNL